MINKLDARTASTIAIVVLIVVLLWDAYLTAQSSRDTISNVITSFNKQTGGLLALAIAALWIHWFLPLPTSWVSDQFTSPSL
jgi:hypothetical protein